LSIKQNKNKKAGVIKMSADIGTYILNTKDGQYRVIHAQAIENIFEGYSSNRYNPLEVVLTWIDCRYTKDYEKAMQIANSMEYRNRTEYGIRIFEFKKTWKHIVEDAKKMADIRLKAISGDSFYDGYMEIQCKRVLNL
jgi:hypothetical protein